MFALACYFLLGKCVKNKKGDRKKKKREREELRTQRQCNVLQFLVGHTLCCALLKSSSGWAMLSKPSVLNMVWTSARGFSPPSSQEVIVQFVKHSQECFSSQSKRTCPIVSTAAAVVNKAASCSDAEWLGCWVNAQYFKISCMPVIWEKQRLCIPFLVES